MNTRVSLLFFVGALSVLSGCAAPPPKPPAPVPSQTTTRPPASPVDVGVNWSYTVVGDAAIRPIQAFSLHGKTYLQMRQNQILPVILVDGRPVPFQLMPPYLVIDGTPNEMDLVSNGWRATVTYGAQPGMPALPDQVGQASRVHSIPMK